MARRGRALRPESIDQLIDKKISSRNKGSSANNSLSQTKTRRNKPAPSNQSVGVAASYQKPRKPSKQDQLKKSLGLEASEDESQMMIIDWAKLQRWKGRPIAEYLHHSPNGGKRGIREASRFKMMGTRAGFPDLMLLIPVEPFHALFIELKTSTGKVSVVQKDYHRLLNEQGYRVEECYSTDSAINVIRNYLGLK